MTSLNRDEPRRITKDATPQQNIEQAVNVTGQKLRSMGEVIAANKEGLTPEAVRKIEFFLTNQVRMLIEELDALARNAIVPVPGRFSLDMDLPAEAPAPALPAGAPLEGRPIGWKNGRPGQQKEQPAPERPKDPTKAEAGIEDADFIDD